MSECGPMVSEVTTHPCSWVFCPLGWRRSGGGFLNLQRLPPKSELPSSELKHVKTPERPQIEPLVMLGGRIPMLQCPGEVPLLCLAKWK